MFERSLQLKLIGAGVAGLVGAIGALTLVVLGAPDRDELSVTVVLLTGVCVAVISFCGGKTAAADSRVQRE